MANELADGHFINSIIFLEELIHFWVADAQLCASSIGEQLREPSEYQLVSREGLAFFSCARFLLVLPLGRMHNFRSDRARLLETKKRIKNTICVARVCSFGLNAHAESQRARTVAKEQRKARRREGMLKLIHLSLAHAQVEAQRCCQVAVRVWNFSMQNVFF